MTKIGLESEDTGRQILGVPADTDVHFRNKITLVQSMSWKVLRQVK